ncbi:MAG TPA: sigma-70 family RNA polymerase sigma factor [Gemmatimonadaceae bacterium]|nr:sigma-70 family RNA polymerase sigma factor [Gemmatimonadaceae bacterium]
MTLPSTPPRTQSQDELYDATLAELGGALGRLARSYEDDLDKRQDLLQDIHLALWRSFLSFDGRCSLRTWVYRVAHNVAASHVVRHRRLRTRLVGLEAIDMLPGDSDTEGSVDRQLMVERLYTLIRRLRPLDRQIVFLYLEGSDAAAIGEITGITAVNVATKINRIKKLLARLARSGGSYDE